MDNFWKDIRYGSRMIIKNPGFTAVAVLSLALGIGVNSTIFSLVNAILLRPLPVSDPDRLVTVFSGSPQFQYSVTSYPDYIDFRDGSDAFTGLAAHSMMSARLSLDGPSEIVLGEIVTSNYFQVLGVEPSKGRWFLPEEDETPGTHAVAVISHGCWERRFGSDPSILGKEIKVNGVVYTIVGVTPDSFTGTLPGLSPEIWVPTMMADSVNIQGMHDVTGSPTGDTRLEQRGTRWLFVKGRLKPGVRLEGAFAQLATIMKRLEQEYPESNEDRSVSLLPSARVRLHPMIDQVLAMAALVILAVVGMVLLIACANVANMLLARASSRKREMGVRLALGASRGRILRQLVTESVLLSALGGALGLLLAHWTAGLLLVFRPPVDIPISLDLGVDRTVFLFTLGLSVLAGLFFGLAPALQAWRTNLVSVLKGDGASTERGERRLNIRNVLVVGQVAVSLVLLVGAGLLVRSLQAAHSMEIGFDADRLAVMRVDMDLNGYDEEQGKEFCRQLLERVRALPDVESAALASRLPVTIDLSITGVYIEGHQQSPDDEPYLVDQTTVGPKYFETFGIPLLQGRDFDETDTEDSPRVAIINEAMARKYWPGENPIGKRFHTDGLDGPPAEIVGVCRQYNVRTIGEEPRPYIHWSRAQDYDSYANLVVRTAGDPATMVGRLRQEMLALEPDLVFTEADTLPSLIEVTLLPVRMGAVLIGLFGLLGMILASVGLYGVVAYSVSRRTREIGLRIALGAETTDVLTLVLRQGMTLVVVGIVLGLAGASALSRALGSVLYGVSAVDPVSFVAAAAVLAFVAGLANYVPAKRAARTDPLIALRYE